MAPTHRYPNAPITEAIIDLRARLRTGQKLEHLQDVRSGEEQAYPHVEATYQAVGIMEVRAGVSASASAQHQQTGYKIADVEGKNVWQSRFDGFTFSRLAPYDRWQSFRDEARRLWNIYRDRMQPEAVTRLAVRFINQIDLPENPVDLKRFFRTTPEVSPELPQLAGFFMQLRIPQSDLQGRLVLNQTIIPPAREGIVSVLLDIDVFRSDDVPQAEDEVWEFFEKLRNRKNEVFEACITDETRGLFA